MTFLRMSRFVRAGSVTWKGEKDSIGASIKIGPGKMGKDILNKTGKRGILDIVTGCPG